MKKIIYLSCLFFLSTEVTNAQFQGAFMMPAFEKIAASTPQLDLSGRTISYIDYEPYQSMESAKRLSKNEAVNLALMLIRDPKDLGLRRDMANIIFSSEGLFIIFFSPSKREWVLDFKPGQTSFASKNSIHCYVL